MDLYSKKRFFFMFLPITVLMIGAQTRVIQSKPGTIRPRIQVELQSSAKYYMGQCPVEVKMNGKISSSAPVTIKYRFEKSAGGEARFQFLRLSNGVKTIPFTWKLNKNGQYWVKLLVVVAGKELRSEMQAFEVKCDPHQRKKILGKLKVPQKAISLEQIGQVRVINPKPVAQQSNAKISEVPKVADLDIIGLNVEPLQGKAYRKIKFSIAIKNISPYRTEHSKSCYLKLIFSYEKTNAYSSSSGESEPYFFVIPEISSGHQVKLEVYFKFYKTARWTIQAYADGKYTVPEIDEKNNSYWKYFYIN